MESVFVNPAWQRFCCVCIGYLFGCILFAEIAANFHKTSLFEEGSGNPGMANAGRVLGKKTAALVLIGDVVKTILAVMLCQWMFPAVGPIGILYTGLGVTLGHDFPFWHHFEGGKGVACICATIILYSPLFGTISCLCGLTAVLLKKGLKVGASLISIVFLVFMLFFGDAQSRILSLLLAILMISKNAVPNKLKDGKPLESSDSSSLHSASPKNSAQTTSFDRIEDSGRKAVSSEILKETSTSHKTEVR